MQHEGSSRTFRMPAREQDGEIMQRELEALWHDLPPPSTSAEVRMLMLFIGTLLTTTDTALDFLPAEERKKVYAIVDTAFRWGILYGQRVEKIDQALVAAGLEICPSSEPEWWNSFLKGENDGTDG